MEKIITIAQQEIGVTEVPANSNKTKYGEWFGLQDVPWCGEFVSWVFHHAGFPLGNIGYTRGFAGCQTAFNHFKANGEITQHPQPGDIVLFDWNGDGRFDHTGIFEKDNGDGTFTSIEGNTAIGNDSNGGQVMRRDNRKYRFATFVHPKVLDKPAGV